MSKFKNLKSEDIEKLTPEEHQELIDYINEEILRRGLKITVTPKFSEETSYKDMAEAEEFFSELAVKFNSDKNKFRN